MKSNRKKILVAISLFLVIVIAIAFMVFRIIKVPLKVDNNITVTVNKGDSFYNFLNGLSDQRVIKNKVIIKMYLKLTNKNLDIKPGKYELSQDMSLDDIVKKLTTASSIDTIKFTVPEGYTIDDIANKLNNEGVCSKDDFINAVNSYQLPDYVKKNSEKRYSLEGYLFPDTYIFNKGCNPNEIVKMMVSKFQDVWNKILVETKQTIKDEDLENIITTASMIEKEARNDKERPVIASVISNRLNKKMKLQIDATVIYALGKHVEVVTYDNLKVKSPYNTYENYGLPIGPISNPGVMSIKAALQPIKSDYLFYVLQKDKTHYFTDNYDDFLKKQKELGYFD